MRLLLLATVPVALVLPRSALAQSQPQPSPGDGQPAYGQPPPSGPPPVYGQPTYGQTAYPPATPAPPALSVEGEEEKKPGWELDAELLGLRGSTLGVSGADHDARTYGVNAASFGLTNATGSILTYRAAARSLIGGGSGGFEGEIGGTLAVGVGFLIDNKQGPFVRVGVQGYIVGNDSFFHSNIQFPQGSVGWHLGSREGFLLEAGLTAGPMLDGRFNAGDQGRRRLGSSGAFGPYVDAFVGPLTATAAWLRTDAVSQPGTPVDSFDGHICLSTGRAKKESGLGLCFDGRITRGDLHFGSPIVHSEASTAYFGLTLGFGFTANRRKK